MQSVQIVRISCWGVCSSLVPLTCMKTTCMKSLTPWLDKICMYFYLVLWKHWPDHSI